MLPLAPLQDTTAVLVRFRLYPNNANAANGVTQAELQAAVAASKQTTILANLMTFSGLIADWFSNDGEPWAPMLFWSGGFGLAGMLPATPPAPTLALSHVLLNPVLHLTCVSCARCRPCVHYQRQQLHLLL